MNTNEIIGLVLFAMIVIWLVAASIKDAKKRRTRRVAPRRRREDQYRG